MKPTLRTVLLIFAAGLMLSLGSGGGCAPNADDFRERPVLQANADQLPSTIVTPHLDVPMEAGKNILWCGTFQLAWNELCTLAGGEVKFAPPQPAMATALNRKEMTAADLDEVSYVAAAGYVRDGIGDRIKQLMKSKFNREPSPKALQDQQLASRPQDIILYSYLWKNLDFPTAFERGEKPLVFGDAKVDNFGISTDKPGHDEIAKQISIYDYQSKDDFVIELQTKSPKDHLILAKIAPGRTLAATIAQVQRRMAIAKPTPALAEDILMVPKMNFDILRDYHELTGRHVLPTVPGMANDLILVTAWQDTRFLMDRKGVQLESEAGGAGHGAAAPPRNRHVMLFDKPFLLLMSREGSKSPYFALWIANADLLVKAD